MSAGIGTVHIGIDQADCFRAGCCIGMSVGSSCCTIPVIPQIRSITASCFNEVQSISTDGCVKINILDRAGERNISDGNRFANCGIAVTGIGAVGVFKVDANGFRSQAAISMRQRCSVGGITVTNSIGIVPATL